MVVTVSLSSVLMNQPQLAHSTSSVNHKLSHSQKMLLKLRSESGEPVAVEDKATPTTTTTVDPVVT